MKNELQAASHGFRVAVNQNKDDSRFGFQIRMLLVDVGIVVKYGNLPMNLPKGKFKVLRNG